ncbi:hypothetical protein M427DRAFT_162130 [Gonapodya prolifera JEL478]|uniref:Uncharacterized protein n=1 Tax=Gonapodya prolifera (strain JEL478) TaxID=1344416 RepID=A0A139AZ75_GONPJ|nr:hypothetical protein M427DRAFT_162130 [Gonapodya prolifera JEL478]|eukprot:KXS22019.1 hypothetical protein M427DRAFT_162130 [Gonapodya prolifera JEL478]
MAARGANGCVGPAYPRDDSWVRSFQPDTSDIHFIIDPTGLQRLTKVFFRHPPMLFTRISTPRFTNLWNPEPCRGRSFNTNPILFQFRPHLPPPRPQIVISSFCSTPPLPSNSFLSTGSQRLYCGDCLVSTAKGAVWIRLTTRAWK